METRTELSGPINTPLSRLKYWMQRVSAGEGVWNNDFLGPLIEGFFHGMTQTLGFKNPTEDIKFSNAEIGLDAGESALENLAVYHLTDLHISSLSSFFSMKNCEVLLQRMKEKIQIDLDAGKQVMVALTGDLINNAVDVEDDELMDFIQYFLSEISGLSDQVNCYFVRGNHDCLDREGILLERVTRGGFQVLQNEIVQLPLADGEHINVFGIDDLIFGEGKEVQDHIGMYKRRLNGALANIVLVHESHAYSIIRELQEKIDEDPNHEGRIILGMSGHTHGARRVNTRWFSLLTHGLMEVYSLGLELPQLKYRDDDMSENVLGCAGSMRQYKGIFNLPNSRGKNPGRFVASQGIGEVGNPPWVRDSNPAVVVSGFNSNA